MTQLVQALTTLRLQSVAALLTVGCDVAQFLVLKTVLFLDF